MRFAAELALLPHSADRTVSPMFELTTDPAKFDDPLLDDPAVVAADHQAVQVFLDTGQPVDMAIRLRIRARADRARERCFQRNGFVNIQDLLPPSTYDE